jgi:hypothetical protein
MTFGAPSLARVGEGQAGDDSSTVRPITPGNGLPGLYSTKFDISISLYAMFAFVPNKKI